MKIIPNKSLKHQIIETENIFVETEKFDEQSKICIRLNIYDLWRINRILNWVGIGAYHTGIVIHNKEYSFGS